jgi:outer membrane cobalamin receptor
MRGWVRMGSARPVSRCADERVGLGYTLGASREKGKGISVISNPASGSFNPDADGYDVGSLDAKFSAQVSSQHALTLGLLRSEMDYQFDGTAYPNPLGLSRLSTDAWARPVLQQAHLSLGRTVVTQLEIQPEAWPQP